MTLMFCAFEGKPLILRAYGKAVIHHEWDASYQKHIGLFPNIAGSRQIIEMEVDLVQTSCGYAVPLMEFKEERSQLSAWSEKKGDDGIRDYWNETNQKSIDGIETKF